MAGLLVGAALLSLCASLVKAQNACDITPIYVDFHDRGVDADVNIQYGLFIGISSPSQNISSWPSLSHNETTVRSVGYCVNSPFDDCEKFSHGFYQPQFSPTHREEPNHQFLDNFENIDASIDQVAIDTLNVFVHYFDPSPPNQTQIEDFPIVVMTNHTSSSTPWYGPAGLLGIGSSSRLLQRLYDAQLISTRSFGLYMGTWYQFSNGQINGSLTLGGYDSGRFEGVVHNYTIVDEPVGGTPFRVGVSQMTLNIEGGDSVDLVEEEFDAYITTSQYDLQLPQAVRDRFVEETSASAFEDAARGYSVFSLPEDFNGTMTITLDTGLNITYPAEWLRNVSNVAPIVSNATTSTSSGLNLLGSAFLSYAYLIANYDAEPPAFHLAPALPHGPYVMTAPLCPDTIPVVPEDIHISAFAGNGIPGAIVAGVIGGIGLTFLVWWLFRKWAQREMWREQNRAAMKGKGLEDGYISKNSPSDFTDGEEEREMTTFSDRKNNPYIPYRDHTSGADYSALPNANQAPPRMPPLLTSYHPNSSEASFTNVNLGERR